MLGTGRRTWPALIAALALMGPAACGGEADEQAAGGGGAEAPSAAVTIEGVTLERVPAAHDALPEEVREAGAVRVAVDAPFPPYALFEDGDEQQLSGFEPELGRALAAVLGVEFDFQKQPFDGIIPALQAGKYDIVMSAMTDTAERQNVLTFVDHSQTGLTIIVPKGNPDGIRTLLDLCGKAVAVQKGTTDELFLDDSQEDCAAAGKPGFEKQSYPKQSNALLAVKSGKAAANFADGAVGGYAAATIDGGEAIEQIVDPEAPQGYRSNPVGIGMLKDRVELRDAVEQALAALMDDGVYEKLLAKYAMDNNGLDAPSIDAGQ